MSRITNPHSTATVIQRREAARMNQPSGITNTSSGRFASGVARISWP